MSDKPTATELVARLARGEVSSCSLVESFLQRIREVNGVLNAAVHIDEAATLAAAEAADRAIESGERLPLLGLPVSVKDSIAVAGMPWWSGAAARRGIVAERDATSVARLKAAGAVVLCKTNLPEYTWSTETDNAVHGRANNPYDLARTCGGSSGGEAALHAVYASPLGLGSDGLCSIRVPCHFCGTVGLRPTVGLVPETGVWPSTRSTGMLDMSTLGPLGRSVDDLALLLRVIAGPDDVDPFVSAVTIGDHRKVDVGALRVGFYTQAAWDVTPGTKSAVEAAAGALAHLGARVDEIEPPSLADVPTLAFQMMAADGGARARADLEGRRGQHEPHISGLLSELEPLALTAGGFFEFMERWIAMRSSIRMHTSAYDAVLCPVVAGPAPKHGRRPSDDGELRDYDEYGYSFAYAVAGLPAAVVPVTIERGTPVGVQVVAPAYHDHVALAVAAELESAFRGAVPPPRLASTPADRGREAPADTPRGVNETVS